MPRQHYMYFVYEFNLIPKREELQPLQELIDKLLERDTGGAARGVLCAASTSPAACASTSASAPPASSSAVAGIVSSSAVASIA